MSEEPSVAALRAFLTTKDKEKDMSITEQDKIDTIRDEAYEKGRHDALEQYKGTLTYLVEKYAEQYNLCDDGLRDFCDEAGIQITRKWSGDLIISIEIEAFGEESAHETMESILEFMKRQAGSQAKVNGHVCEVQNVQRES